MKITRSALLPFAADKMFDLVADIDSYAEFLSWCNSSDVLQQQDDLVEARLGIRLAGLSMSFSTRNKMLPNRRIDMHLLSGPFKTLGGYWQFESLNSNASKVSLELEFEFDSMVTQKLLSPKFKSLISSQLDAFQQRAEVIYGS